MLRSEGCMTCKLISMQSNEQQQPPSTVLAHHLHCLCCTSALQVKLAACPAIFDTLSCRHSCVREPSTVVRTLQAARFALYYQQQD
jgi:hypothetical protein